MHYERRYCHEIKSQLVFGGPRCVPLGLVAMALPVSRPPWPGRRGTACVCPHANSPNVHQSFPDMKYDFSLK